MSKRKGFRIVSYVFVGAASLLLLALLFRMVDLSKEYSGDIAKYRAERTIEQKNETETSDETILLEKMNQVQSFQTIVFVAMIVYVVLAAVILVLTRIGQHSAVYRVAYYDEVTGLPTKAKHREELSEKLRNGKHDYAYVSFEVDNFRYVNDLYGYSYGNYALKHVASIEELLEDGELMARTAGARFGLLLFFDGEDEFRERLFGMFSRVSQIKGDDSESVYEMTFTAGAYIVRSNESPSKVREYANIAREAAQDKFDNNLVFYNEAMQQKRKEQAELERDMRPALSSNEFVVYLQPKYSTESEMIVGAEALIRWTHPRRGLLSPNEFIPLFEANGFIVKIDLFVLETVCRCIRGWLDDGITPIVLSVNLSRIHLYDRDLVSNLVTIVDRYQVPHHLIEFELTETLVFEEMDNLLEVMAKLKDAGFILSMDDFGTGYSSLNMLRRLSVDILKMDKGFIENFTDGEVSLREQTIVAHVISMAKALDMEVLMEGVETECQKEFLLNTDCDMIQGYYYAKPMDISIFDGKYRETQRYVAG